MRRRVRGIRGVDREPRPVSRLPRAAGRPAAAHRRPGDGDRRQGQADLPPDRRPAQRRDGPAGDADGAGLPARRRRLAAHQPDPRQRHRVDHARRPSPTAAIATSTGTTRTRPRKQARASAYGGPPYWGKYILHDNNRDFNFSQLTTRAILDWYLQWHPPIMHDLHESVPFLYTFSGQAPQNPTLDPILYGELPWFANFEMAQMIKYGMPGVWTHAFVDMWYPGYMGFMASNHNGMLRMYETFGNGGANTMKRRDRRRRRGRHGRRRRPDLARVVPAAAAVRGGRVVASATTPTTWRRASSRRSQLTSAFPKVVLENFYRKSRNSIESGRKDAPFGYVIPAGGRDRTRVAWVVNILRMQGIEVGRATAEVKLKEGTFPAGSLHRQARPAVRPAREDPAREAELPRSEPAHVRRHRLDDGPDDAHRREGDRGQGDPRRAGPAGDEGGARRDGLGRGRVDRRRRAPRLGQHDHAALPAEGPRGRAPPSSRSRPATPSSRPVRSSSTPAAAPTRWRA